MGTKYLLFFPSLHLAGFPGARRRLIAAAAGDRAIVTVKPGYLRNFISNINRTKNMKLMTFQLFEPRHEKTNKMACAPSEDSGQPGHPPRLISVFAARMKKAWVLSYPTKSQRSLWSDWADAQADLGLRWVRSHFVGSVVLRLILSLTVSVPDSQTTSLSQCKK